MNSSIPIEDLEITRWPEDHPNLNPGGQHVGSGPYGVKIKHIPSGIIACVEIGSSQHKNKEIAMDMILAALTNRWYR
jgi:protein subunit release factor A